MRFGGWFGLLMTASLLAWTAEGADGPIPPAEAPAHMKLPPGFKVTLFAGEPDVVQPIAMTFDERGRLWVVECNSYPGWKGDSDRVLIFTDRDGDGRFDERQVFLDHASNLSGIAVGHGGIWLCALPNVLFVPDADRDDRPDRDPQVVLDGWDLQKAGHNAFNSLLWGPDGWLYGCNGIQSNSVVGRPGTPEADRVRINCGVWRYHPTRQVFEAVAHGTTNPWGLDYDDFGQMFITNCVIDHLWHVVPGAHFQRMYGQDINPYCFELMKSCADHLHWVGGSWQEARGGDRHSDAGGGHAHVGAMVYLGSSWPAEYRNHLFVCNLHGNRLNQDILARQGSGYVAHHGADFLMAGDPWFRGLTILQTPDGGAMVSDWCDTGECHNYQVVDRSNGRIYKVSYGAAAPFNRDLRNAADEDLVAMQADANDWLVRQSRRLLAERAAAGKLADTTRPKLLKMLHDDGIDPKVQLRALWALHGIGGAGDGELLSATKRDSEYLRGWAVQLAADESTPCSALLWAFERLAEKDPSPFVRLQLASVLRKLPNDARWGIGAKLLAHGEDRDDQNLPLMIWYGVEPLVAADVDRALQLAGASKIDKVTNFVARRASGLPGGTAATLRVLAAAADESVMLALLDGLEAGFSAQRNVPLPTEWPAAYARLSRAQDNAVRRRAVALALIFGDRQALESLRKIAADSAADTRDRAWALESLAQARDASIVPTLQDLVGNEPLAAAAIRALALFDDARTPEVLLGRYQQLTEEQRRDAVATLCSRPGWAIALLTAIERGELPRTVLDLEHVRQLASFKQPEVVALVEKVWGAARQTPADKQQAMEKYRSQLQPAALRSADLARGRALFDQSCANCHTLFDHGGKLAPDLTGSQRSNLDYLLLNVVDPNATVPRDYQLVLIQTTDGRVLNGIVKEENESTLALQTPSELIRLAKSDIEERKQTVLSMMPEGLLDKLSPAELRDLVGYLASPRQIAPR